MWGTNLGIFFWLFLFFDCLDYEPYGYSCKGLLLMVFIAGLLV